MELAGELIGLEYLKGAFHEFLGGRSPAVELVFQAEALILGGAEVMVGQQLHQSDGVAQLLAEFCGGVHILLAVVQAGDNRIAYLQLAAVCGNEAGVFQYLLVGYADQLLVLIGVHVLDVVEEKVHIGDDFGEVLGAGKAGGIQTDVDAAVLQSLGQVVCKVELAHGLAAGDGDAAAVLEEHSVLDNAVIYLIDGGVPAGGVYGAVHADVNALEAFIALGVVHADLGDKAGAVKSVFWLANGYGALLAGVHTEISANLHAQALYGQKAYLKLMLLRLGTVAPEAAERAALGVNSGADTGAVVYRISLYIIYAAGYVFIFQ